MPRMARVVLPNGPHHVVQRGHNRQVVFAYCLMTNHVHLLLAPGECTAGLSQLMKALAARATRYRVKRGRIYLWRRRQ